MYIHYYDNCQCYICIVEEKEEIKKNKTMRSFVLLSCFICSIFLASATDYVAISEILFNTPLNEDTTQTPHNFDEFIEIYNAHDEPVSLNGWKLQTLYPEQTFNFPDIQLAGKSFLIVAYGPHIMLIIGKSIHNSNRRWFYNSRYRN